MGFKVAIRARQYIAGYKLSVFPENYEFHYLEHSLVLEQNDLGEAPIRTEIVDNLMFE